MLAQTMVKNNLMDVDLVSSGFLSSKFEKRVFAEETHLHMPRPTILRPHFSPYAIQIREFQKSQNSSLVYQDEYNAKNGLDQSIVKRMYSRFWVVEYSSRGEDGYAPTLTIRDFISISKQHHNESSTTPWHHSAATTLYQMFHGVNKSLPLPTLLTPLTNQLINESESKVSNGHCAQKICIYVNLYERHEVVHFNCRNLIRYYNYPKKDAKALYDNLKLTNIKLFMPMHDTNLTGEPPHRVLPITYVNDQHSLKSVCWDVPEEFKSIDTSSCTKADLIKLIEEMMSSPLPITKISIWRAMCKEWFNQKAERDVNWDQLGEENQKRHIVNYIRHSHCGYSQIYTFQDRDAAREMHDVAFDALLRHIGRTIPYLRTECIRQLNYRFDEVCDNGNDLISYVESPNTWITL
ncbi:hypothetical protein KEC58_21145 (plasmid) [Photobacterium damselae]|uniref:hypothetical protein n=1 Tax=Photobacterium damselae TaxID=38293 RepID=UPI00254356F9